LYLFGRVQDIGFQEAVGHSPRRRHHIRFWGAPATPIQGGAIESLFDSFKSYIDDREYWTRLEHHENTESVIWVGAGTKDIGLDFRRLAYHVTHKVDAHVDAERDYILRCLAKGGQLHNIRSLAPGTPISDKYVSDRHIATGCLAIHAHE
jgi:hypothetical protein